MKKKVAYIGHSYHAKTKSTVFFINLLMQSYDVELILEESWCGKPQANLSYLDDSYHAVIFFQSISPKLISMVKCKNIIFIPMYDESGSGEADYWVQYKDLKIINFSKTLHYKLLQMQFNTINIQYYPEPQEYIKNNNISVFFWQRTNSITWDTVKRLLGKNKVDSVHIHRAVDPFQELVKPTEEDEIQYNITYSDWFETREQYLSMVKNKMIYIAPRYMEGIGFSFLEAMSFGKVIIAADQPTMNEYIKHNYNGYLYNLSQVTPINMHNIHLKQENSYQTIVEGRKAWEKNKYMILDFIDAPNKRNFYFAKCGLRNTIIKGCVKRFIKGIIPYGIVRLYQLYKQKFCK